MELQVNSIMPVRPSSTQRSASPATVQGAAAAPTLGTLSSVSVLGPSADSFGQKGQRLPGGRTCQDSTCTQNHEGLLNQVGETLQNLFKKNNPPNKS